MLQGLEVLPLQRATVRTEQHGPLDRGLKLADVARPVVGEQCGESPAAHAVDALSIFGGGAGSEDEQEGRQVVPPLTQGRQTELKATQAVVEIGTE